MKFHHNTKKHLKEKIKFQDLPSGRYNAHHLFIIEVENRKELYDFLHSKGILAQIHYIPIHIIKTCYIIKNRLRFRRRS